MLSQVWHYLASFCLFLATITFLLIIHRTSAALYNSRVYANQAALTGGNYATNYVSTNSGSMEMSLDELYRCSGERSRRRRRRKRQEEAVDEEENGQEDEEEELEKQTEELSRSRVKRRVPRPPFEVPYDISDEGDQFYY